MNSLTVVAPNTNLIDFDDPKSWPDKFTINVADDKRMMFHPISMQTIWVAMADKIQKLGYNVNEYRDEVLRSTVLLCTKKQINDKNEN